MGTATAGQYITQESETSCEGYNALYMFTFPTAQGFYNHNYLTLKMLNK